MESVSLIAMFVFRKHKKFDGQMCLIYLGGYGIGRCIVEGIRTDQLLIPGTQIAVSQLLGFVMFIGAVIADIVIRMRLRKKTGLACFFFVYCEEKNTIINNICTINTKR